MTTHTQSNDLHAAPPRTAFVWSAGGWLGAQLGSTLWMALLGLALLGRDVPSAVVCLAGFALANAIGTALWRARERRSAYAAIQMFLASLAVLVAILVLVVRARGATDVRGGRGGAGDGGRIRG